VAGLEDLDLPGVGLEAEAAHQADGAGAGGIVGGKRIHHRDTEDTEKKKRGGRQEEEKASHGSTRINTDQNKAGRAVHGGDMMPSE
jgi:hypothetical protein